MTVHVARDFLLWCAVLNYVVLLLWFLAFVFAHGWMFTLHKRWFHLSEDRFDSIHYAGMAAYKIGILLLNLAPYVVISNNSIDATSPDLHQVACLGSACWFNN